MSDLSYRPATLDDLIQIEKLVNTAYRGETSRQGWTTEADLLDGQRTDKEALHDIINATDNIIILCHKANQLIGTVHLHCEQEICHFGMFTIQPSLQNLGIGKKFIAYAEKYARNTLGCTYMAMTVIDLRTELLQWYERRGYINTGKFAKFPYGNERFGIPRRDDLVLTILKKSLV